MDSKIEPTSERCVVNDIPVFDSRSGELVLTLMGAQFTSIPFRSLEKSFSRLNIVYEKNDLGSKTAHIEASPIQDDTLVRPDYIETSRTDRAVLSNGECQSDQAQLLKRVQDMLSEMVEIPISEIQPDSALADLGVD